jgi:2-methylaconitate cis-trans-isomerase PrpF
MAHRAIPCGVLRGGTSKGLYFHSIFVPGAVWEAA